MAETTGYAAEEPTVEGTVRTRWLKGMYAANVAFGILGLAVVVVPETVRGLLGVPAGDPIHFGIAAGAVPLAFGIAGLMGLRSPVRLSPVLGLQAVYKTVFLVGVVGPMAVTGRVPAYALPLVGIFAAFVLGDLVAVPVPYLLGRQSDP
jgi:hypothetical protein